MERKDPKVNQSLIPDITISNAEGHCEVVFERNKIGVYYEGNLYRFELLRNAEIVAEYQNRGKGYAACIIDCYGRYWYYMAYDCTVYDDYHQVWIAVKDEEAARKLYDKIGVNTWNYFPMCEKGALYPHFRANISNYLWLCVDLQDSNDNSSIQYERIVF